MRNANMTLNNDLQYCLCLFTLARTFFFIISSIIFYTNSKCLYKHISKYSAFKYLKCCCLWVLHSGGQ